MNFRNYRYDYILIWGNGLSYKDEIINLIEKNDNFEIVKIIRKTFSDIAEIVNAVYSYDYAPIEHLRMKIKYLYTTLPEVIFIFIKNKNPDEDYLGEGEFRHIESLTLKKFKEQIRDKFNERKEDRRTENHVIHASDNQKQTDYILKFLGLNGIDDIKTPSTNIINVPTHIGARNKFLLYKISIEYLRGRIICGEIDNINIIETKIEDTPHYKTLKNKTPDYDYYLEKYQGIYLNDYYSSEKFLTLAENLVYPYNNNYITVSKRNGYYSILDGLHRASILKYRNEKNIIIAEVL